MEKERYIYYNGKNNDMLIKVDEETFQYVLRNKREAIMNILSLQLGNGQTITDDKRNFLIPC